jgi:hypothetical protein
LGKEAATTKRWEFSGNEFRDLCIRSGAVDLNAPASSQRRLLTDLKMQLANKGLITITGNTIRLAQLT